MTLRDQTCCFTGHRKLFEENSAILERINVYLNRLLQKNVRFFWLGGALGFDTLMAEHLLSLKKYDPQIQIYLALPFEGYRSRWSASQQARAAQIDAQAASSFAHKCPLNRLSCAAIGIWSISPATVFLIATEQQVVQLIRIGMHVSKA